MTLKSPCPSKAMPIITTIAPVTLLIHSIVFILKLLRKRRNNQEILNQYVTDPALTERIIGVTLQLCGASSARPKNAKSVNITNMAIGLDCRNHTIRTADAQRRVPQGAV